MSINHDPLVILPSRPGYISPQKPCFRNEVIQKNTDTPQREQFHGDHGCWMWNLCCVSGGFKMFQWLIHVFPVDVICESSTVGSSDPAHLAPALAHWTPFQRTPKWVTRRGSKWLLILSRCDYILLYYYYCYYHHHNNVYIYILSINGNSRTLNWRYLLYIRPMWGLCKWISQQNMALHGTVPSV